MQRIILAGVLGVVALAGAYLYQGFSATASEPAYMSAETVALGKSIYDAECASCHGADLAGQPDWQTRGPDGYLPAPPHDETGHTWHHPTEQLFEITQLGTEAIVGGGYKSNMAGFGDILSDAEIYATLAYIKSTWPDRIIARHNQLDAAYEDANRE